MGSALLTLLVLLAVLFLSPSLAHAPHLFFLLVDDLGSANVGFSAKALGSAPSREVVTPNLDALAASGVVLTRNYNFKFCSPTRTSIQTGRSPIHVNVLNSDVMQHNAGDPVGGFMGRLAT